MYEGNLKLATPREEKGRAMTIREKLAAQFNAHNGKWAFCGNTFLTKIWFCAAHKLYVVVEFRNSITELKAEIVQIGYESCWAGLSTGATFYGTDGEERALDWLTEYVMKVLRNLGSRKKELEGVRNDRAKFENILYACARGRA